MKKILQFEVQGYISVLILIGTLFSLVIFKMEVRRKGYSVLKSTQEYRLLQDRYRRFEMDYAQITRSDRVRSYALSKLTLGEAKDGQIIQLMGRNIAVPQ